MVENKSGSLNLADLILNITDTFKISSVHKGSRFFLGIASVFPLPP